MACGTAVLASNGGALPGVVSDAGVLFDPTSISDLSDKMGRLLEDEAGRRELAERGLRRAAGFTWQAAAQATLRVYRSVIEKGY